MSWLTIKQMFYKPVSTVTIRASLPALGVPRNLVRFKAFESALLYLPYIILRGNKSRIQCLGLHISLKIVEQPLYPKWLEHVFPPVLRLRYTLNRQQQAFYFASNIN